MLGWLWRAVVGRFGCCEHHWETIATAEIIRSRDAASIGHAYHLRCKECGDVKIRNLSINS